MAELAVKDGTGATVYLKETGTGGASDGYRPNVVPSGARNAGVAHRASIAAADLLANPAQLAAGTGVTVTSATLASATTYGYTIVARNAIGTTLAATVRTSSPGGSFNAIRIVIPQTTGATFYEIFLSTSTTGPTWVVSLDEATRAAGGGKVTTAGTLATGGAAPAGQFDIGVVGTGLASNSATFSVNTAYVVPGSITPINCAGYSRAHVLVKLTLTDWRSQPTLVLTPWFLSQTDTGVYYAGSPVTLSLGGATGGTLMQEVVFELDGATGFLMAVDTISGQGASANLYVELA